MRSARRRQPRGRSRAHPLGRLTAAAAGRLGVAGSLLIALMAGSLGGPAFAAEAPLDGPAGPGWSKSRPVGSGSVKGEPLTPRPRSDAPSDRRAATGTPRVVRPRAGGGDIDIVLTPGAAKATPVPGTPVRVTATGTGSPQRVRVDVLDPAAADRAGIDGVLFRVERSDGPRTAAPIEVGIDYSGFRRAYGGDYASRLTLVRLPACAATTPKRPACVRGTPLKAHNDTGVGLISGRISAGPPARATGPGGRPGTTAPAALYAVTSAPGGSAGSFKPSSLGPSSLWEVGLQSGDFAWSYPIGLPSVPGLEPEIALSYSSGAVDGRTAATNNQASWLGEGFDFQPGFIERQYAACGADAPGGNNTAATGDLCYAGQNATVALPGVAGELVWDATKRIWRAEDDDGWRVEQLFGASNGDNDGEHWRLTSPDGTQYHFGRAASAKSAWTVPVYGNHPGEPCNAASYATSWCQQTYRWMLDHVVSRNGDIVTYTYDTETNHYGRDNTPSAATPYVRGGHLTRIDYGLRAGQSEPDARVLFTASDRCLPGSSCLRTAPADWPDVPWDQQCDGGTCVGRHSPAFFGTKKLERITAQVRDGGRFKDVTSWQLRHAFLAPGDQTDPSLWLESIARTGHVGGTVTEPPVTFGGTVFPNRLTVGDGLQPMNKWRLTRVGTESGGEIKVDYAPAGCTATALPVPDTNGRPCFPAHWNQEGVTQPRLDWFNKFLVTEVREIDRVGGNPDEVTSYEYVGDAAWRHDEAELVPPELKTWGQWRGYRSVKVRTGAAGSVRTLDEHRFHRGMHGDRKLDGTTKDVEIAARKDEPALRGFAYEEITYNGDGGPEIERTLSEPVAIGPSAERSRPAGSLRAFTTEVKRTHTRTALAGGGHRETEEIHEYDAYGVNHRTHDRGDLAVPGDDTCTTVAHTPNLTDWIIGAPHRVETVGAPCGTPANGPDDVISDVRTYYDGSATLGTAPVRGDATRVEELSAWAPGGGTYTTVSRHAHDAHGRVTEEWDALGNRETTAYTPATGGPVTEVRTTNALGHEDITGFHPLLGTATSSTDAAGRRAELVYDPLGRLVKAWGPGRATSRGPDAEFSYLIRPDGPAAVTSRTLLGTGRYSVSHTLYDGFLRLRQTQEPAPGGGRIVSDTLYDSHGRAARVNDDYHNPAAPGTTILRVDDAAVPSQTEYVFDGADREIAEIQKVNGVEKWRTGTTYGGNWTREDPPRGGTSTTELFDAEGRTTELRQHRNATEYDATRYTYTKSGLLASITDPAGNNWRHTYDVRGRQTRSDDPDKGTITRTFDDADQLLTVTDSRGRTIRHVYDAQGRRTAAHENSVTGPKLAELTYDTLGKGLPVASIRYSGGNAYRSEILGYDERGRSTGTAVTIPAAEGALAGRYESAFTYNEADQITSTTLPGAGGLPAETLRQAYDDLGLPVALTGLDSYVAHTEYDNLGAISEFILGTPGRQLRQSFGYETGTRRLVTSRTEQEGQAAPTVERSFTYDPSGNVTRLMTAALGRPTDTQCFGTDHLQRVTEAWTPDGTCSAPPTVAGLSGPAPYWHSYTFDVTGNRQSETLRTPAGTTTRTYAYPAAGSAQPHALRSVSQSGADGTRTDSFAYDSDGNTTSRTVDGVTQTLTWDSEGLLESVSGGGTSTSYLHSAEGDRLLRREPGATTLYLGGTELRLDTTTQAVTGTRHYTMHDSTIAVRTPGGLTWLAADHHGTGETAVDDSTQQVTHRLHLPYGAARGGSGSPGGWPGQKGFVGGTQDPSTGLTQLGARAYDPLTGRFISVDPVIDFNDPQQMNGYAYANNNPVSFTDPDGLTPKKTKKKQKKTKPAVSAKSSKSVAFCKGDVRCEMRYSKPKKSPAAAK
ncbi:RHS repeat-associated core domain-containing protein, partial [Streptomyces sp. NPDC055078]